MIAIGPPQPFDRRLLIPGAIACLAVLVVDAAWIGLGARYGQPLGSAVAGVLAVIAGSVVAARAPGRLGWTALFAGGAVGSVLAAAILVLATLDSAWGFVGAVSLVASDGLFGAPLAAIGFGYWTMTAAALREHVSARSRRLLQATVLLVAGLVFIAAVTTLIPATR